MANSTLGTTKLALSRTGLFHVRTLKRLAHCFGIAAPPPGRFANRPYGGVGVRCDAGYTYSGIGCRWFVTSPRRKRGPTSPLDSRLRGNDEVGGGMTRWGVRMSKWETGLTNFGAGYGGSFPGTDQ